jgi:tRNA1(Val) A37 N6-methylase TrmN6
MIKKITRQKELGAFYTPEKIADFLVKWAVRSPTDLVLDPGAGEGVFFKLALKRLMDLGATLPDSLNQVYGVEIDRNAFLNLKDFIIKTYPKATPRILNANFFDIIPEENGVPMVDVVVGNPPYIERQRLSDITEIRQKIFRGMTGIERISGLTDIYGYFLLHSSRFLKPGGRLALIISDTWLDMDFGKEIKEFLKKFFRIKAIIGFDKRVFPRALVRTVLLLAEKTKTGEHTSENKVLFIRLKEPSEVDGLIELLQQNGGRENLRVLEIPQEKLRLSEPWSVYLKMPLIYFKLLNNPLITRLSRLAKVNIGLQSLKKDFFIMDEILAKERRIEPEYLERIAVSPRDVPLVINSRDDVRHFVLYCDKPKEHLVGTNLLRYIEKAEKKPATPRGKKLIVVGYHNIPRIKKSGRNPWYNVKTEIDKRCRAPILIPRRGYHRFFVVWNKANVAVNENFICVTPFDPCLVTPLLSVLNSSIMELILRVSAHLYGGGVYYLRPEDVKNLPVLDISKISAQELEALHKAYEAFIATKGDRTEIDKCLAKILGLTLEDEKQIEIDLKDLKELSLTSKG